jgi:LysR family hydrogen peroxide-inducible transcriptional activator
MSVIRPSTRHLEYALAVAETLNFRQAAKLCHVTQPALSAQVAQLEELLGVRLFERDRRGVVVNPSGTEILQRARAVLNLLDDMMAKGRNLAAPFTGDLRLAVIPTVAPFLLPRVTPMIRRDYPDLRLLLREEQTDTCLAHLAAGKIELALLALEVDLGDVEVMPLFEDPFVLAVPSGHRLAKRRRVRESELENEEVLLLDDGHCLRDHALEVCKSRGAHEMGDFRASSLSTLIEMVASGIGSTLLPKMAIDAYVRHGLSLLPFQKPAPFRTIGLIWRKGSSRADEFRAIGTLFKNAGAAI